MKFYVIAGDWLSGEDDFVEAIAYKSYEAAAESLDSRQGVERDWPPAAGYWVKREKGVSTGYYTIKEVTVNE